MTELRIPELALVALVGTSGSGKSTFAARHFGRYEVVSSDECRGIVDDDPNSQDASSDAFDLVHYIAGKRLARGRLVVVDATNVQKAGRAELVKVAKAQDCLPVAIVLDVPVSIAVQRNESRADRSFGAEVVRRQHDQLRRSIRGLEREGFRIVHVLKGVEAIEAATIVREPLRNDRRDLHGPFDVVGDVHGCRAELEALFDRLGYTLVRDEHGRAIDATHPQGRTVVFVGDLVDRGPDSPGVLRLAMGMVEAGHALVVTGNHENKLVRALNGRAARLSHGLAETMEQLAREPEDFREEVRRWCSGLIAHYVLDEGRLVVAHAGLPERYHGRASGRVRAFALYGDTTGETDEFGLPVRYPWAQDYRGRATVLYGHTPTPMPEWVNGTMCLDTGCVFGGHLTALRYPEREVVQVPAEQVWYEPVKPLAPPAAPERAGDEVSLDDVLGARSVVTAQHGRIAIRPENAAGAFESMSRFALHPRWLPYLPPTMSPVETTPALPREPEPDREGYLEHPAEAFTAYANWAVPQVICEEKHMGSRAVALVCRDAEVGARRFGEAQRGVVYTRTGRSFFDPTLTDELLGRLGAAVERAGLWDELGTDWLLLDAELLPWSAKAEALLRQQYAAVGAAARGALPPALAALRAAGDRGLDIADLLSRSEIRQAQAEAFTAAYRRYCWPTDGLAGVQVAPFQVLATEGATYESRDHGWHLEVADRLVAADPELVRPTRRLVVDTGSPESCAEGERWWLELTDAGGEGMVVKPLANLVRGPKGLVQPGLKVRGREYLRIIYGPDYTLPQHLSRLRARSLGHKRSLALREYALGLEALTRLALGEPTWRTHEPVFAILALEAEPVDPRL